MQAARRQSRKPQLTCAPPDGPRQSRELRFQALEVGERDAGLGHAVRTRVESEDQDALLLDRIEAPEK
jgi:hypothetical protein